MTIEDLEDIARASVETRKAGLGVIKALAEIVAKAGGMKLRWSRK